MAEERYLVLSDIDGSSNAQRFDTLQYAIVESGQVIEREYGFEGAMGETVCRHTKRCPNHYFTDFDCSDGTLRLPPAVTTAATLDIAYTPIVMWEDWDAAGLRAFYIQYRDTTTTPDIVVKKFDVRDDSVIDTELSTVLGGAATETAPRMGKVVVFEGATYVPTGDESGTNFMRKCVCNDIDTPTVDTWTDDDVFCNTASMIDDEGVAKFVKMTANGFKLAATTPLTDANYSGNVEVGDSSDPIVWSVEAGGFVYACKPNNLFELDTLRSRPVLDFDPNRSNKALTTYDDFDGHMSAAIGNSILYPSRRGFARYRNGQAYNFSVDRIPGYRNVLGIDDVPIGLRHYATETYEDNIYSIYKPEGFANTQNCHIMHGTYDRRAPREIVWRNLITRTRDLMGLKIDSDNKLRFVENPNDPAVSAGTVTHVSSSSATGSGTSLEWSHTVASGTQRALIVGISVYDSSLAYNAWTVHFGTQEMSLVKFQKNGDTLSTTMWVLVNPTVQTANIVATFAASVDGIVGGASNYTGVYQSEPLRNATSSIGSDTAPTVTVTSATNDVVVDNLASAGAETTTEGASQTARWDTASGSTVTGSGSEEAGAASVVMSWTLGASQDWATCAASLRPGALAQANADLNYIQLANDGSPRTAMGRDRGAVSSTYEHYFAEVFFEQQLQARYIRVETEGFDSTTSLQLKIHRDGGAADSIGSAITSDDWHKVEFTPGTTDSLRRGRLAWTLTTNGSYAPTTSDPRTLRAVLGLRGPDIYRCVLKLGKSERQALAERKKLRKRKGSGIIQAKESWTGTQYRCDVLSVRDLPMQDGEYQSEVVIRRYDVES